MSDLPSESSFQAEVASAERASPFDEERFTSRFEQALARLIEHEGGFVDDPADLGGATKFGISLRWLQRLDQEGDLDQDGVIDAQDIRGLTYQAAASLYYRHWWCRYNYEYLPELIGMKIFDLAVNMGARPAHRLLQRASRSCGTDLREDGILGPLTREACQRIAGEALLSALRSEAAGYYRLLCSKNPKLKCFLNGWLRRAYA